MIVKPPDPRDPHALLAGATVVVTRPVGATAALANRVRRLGGRAVVLPGLALRAPPDVDAVRRTLQSISADTDWIFSSPAAVRFAFRILPTLQLAATARVFSVGAGTSRALLRRGFSAQYPSQRQDSEGLLALDALSAPRDRRIVLIGAPGGRDVIAPALRERGALVETVSVYERSAPRLTRRHFEALARASSPLITLVSSGDALTHLVALLPSDLLERLRRETLVVSSARLVEMARARGFAAVGCARSALADDLLEAAQHALARHRL